MSEGETYANIYVPLGMSADEALKHEDSYYYEAEELMQSPLTVAMEIQLAIIQGWPVIVACKSKKECEQAKHMFKLVTLEFEGEA